MTDLSDAPKAEALTTNDLRGKTLTGLRWSLSGTTIRTIIEVSVLIALSWLLTPAEFGVATIGISIIGVMTLFVELGLAPSIIQRPTLDDAHIASALVVALLAGLLMIAVDLLLARPIADALAMPDLAAPLAVYSVLIILQPYTMILDGLARRQLKFRAATTADICGALFGYAVVALAGAAAGFGLWALVLGQIMQLLVRAGYLTRVTGVFWTRGATLRHVREILGLSAFFSASRIADYLGVRIDRILVGGLMGSEAAGLYQRIQNLLQITYRQVAEPLDYVMFPIMARIQDNQERLWRSFRAGTAAAGLLTLPATVIAIQCSPGLVPVIFGPNWTSLIGPLQVLLLATFTRPTDRITSALARATGRVKELAFINAFYVLLVVVAVAAGYRSGLLGVAATVLTAYSLKFLMMNHLARRILGISFRRSLSPFVPGGAIACAVEALGIAAHRLFGSATDHVAGALAFAAVAGVVWIAGLMLVPNAALPRELVALRDQVLVRLRLK